jgi:polysaccharide biosynthesis protein PslH
MKILLLSHAAPYPPDLGPAQRMYHELVEMLKRHSVSVLSFGSPEEELNFRKHFGDTCHPVVFVPRVRSRWTNLFLRLWYMITGRSEARTLHTRQFQRALDELVYREKFDLIQCSTPLLGYYRFPSGIPVIGDTHNVEYDNAYRAYRQSTSIARKLYYLHLYLTLRREEVNCCKKFDVLFPTSERDQQVFRERLPAKRMVVIPNGLNVTFFKPDPTTPKPKSLVFTGLMNYYPNEHGMLFFLDNILPLIVSTTPDVLMTIVGAHPSKKLRDRALDNPNVTVTGYVEDVRPYVGAAQVYVVPLLMGGGTRQKVLLAMAMKKPIVSTTLGCEGITLKHEESALFADSPSAFADAVVRLFNDKALADRLADNAESIVHAEYRWESIGDKMHSVYDSLTQQARTEF